MFTFLSPQQSHQRIPCVIYNFTCSSLPLSPLTDRCTGESRLSLSPSLALILSPMNYVCATRKFTTAKDQTNTAQEQFSHTHPHSPHMHERMTCCLEFTRVSQTKRKKNEIVVRVGVRVATLFACLVSNRKLRK